MPFAHFGNAESGPEEDMDVVSWFVTSLEKVGKFAVKNCLLR